MRGALSAGALEAEALSAGEPRPGALCAGTLRTGGRKLRALSGGSFSAGTVAAGVVCAAGSECGRHYVLELHEHGSNSRYYKCEALRSDAQIAGALSAGAIMASGFNAGAPSPSRAGMPTCRKRRMVIPGCEYLPDRNSVGAGREWSGTSAV